MYFKNHTLKDETVVTLRLDFYLVSSVRVTTLKGRNRLKAHSTRGARFRHPKLAKSYDPTDKTQDASHYNKPRAHLLQHMALFIATGTFIICPPLPAPQQEH